VAVRLSGLLLLVVCAAAACVLHGWVATPPQHQPTVLEMLGSLVAVLSGCGGAMALTIGRALFEPYVWPPRSE
jgi:hypothetical protein